MILVLLQRFLGRGPSRSSGSVTLTPEETVLQIQRGDLRLRNQFITDYQPFTAKAASRFCRRYIDPARDDEFAVALSAFNEAISQFSPQSGRAFLGFAETVIRRRLIDYVRKEQRFAGQIPYSSFDMEDDEDHIHNPVEVDQAIRHYEVQQGLEERRSEIMEISRVLGDFDISFADLADHAPKHSDTRAQLMEVGRLLASDSGLMRTLLSKRMLPIKELLPLVPVSRKTLERNRRFLIAVAIIHNGPYPYLREYLQPVARRGEGSEP